VTNSVVERQSVREAGGCRNEVHVVRTPLRFDRYCCGVVRAAARKLIDGESHELKENQMSTQKPFNHFSRQQISRLTSEQGYFEIVSTLRLTLEYCGGLMSGHDSLSYAPGGRRPVARGRETRKYSADD
jgi:hypothetical protein